MTSPRCKNVEIINCSDQLVLLSNKNHKSFNMLGASFLPARLRHEHGPATTSNPGYLNRQITPLLQTIARSAFTHPIHTIVFVAFLASTCYVGVLEGSLFDRANLGGEFGSTDINSLVEGGRSLRLGQETSWKWETVNGGSEDAVTARDSYQTGYWKPLTESQDAKHTMVMTLVFPDSLSSTSPRNAPAIEEVAIPANSSVKTLPSTWNALSPISQDTTIAFAVPSDEAADFLVSIQELPNTRNPDEPMYDDLSIEEADTWIMRASKNGSNPTQPTMRISVRNTWGGFVDLVKVGCVLQSRIHDTDLKTECGVTRYCDHGPWLLVYAPNFRISFHVDEEHGIQLLACVVGFTLLGICFLIWYYCDNEVWSTDQLDFTIRRIAIPCGHYRL